MKAPYFLIQKNLNTKTGIFQNLVLMGTWDFDKNVPINTEVKFSKNENGLNYSKILKFQDINTAKKYQKLVNEYGYKMEVTDIDSRWELKINQF